MKRHKSSLPGYKLVILVALALTGFTVASQATESAGSSYLLCYQDIMSGVMPEPGFYVRNDAYTYHGSIDKLVINGRVDADVSMNLALDLVAINQVTDVDILGSKWGWAAGLPFVRAEINGDAHLSGHPNVGNSFNGDKSDVGDLCLCQLCSAGNGAIYMPRRPPPFIRRPEKASLADSVARMEVHGANRFNLWSTS